MTSQQVAPLSSLTILVCAVRREPCVLCCRVASSSVERFRRLKRVPESKGPPGGDCVTGTDYFIFLLVSPLNCVIIEFNMV